MKDRLTKLFTTFLAVVLLVGMSPAAASTAYAASWNSGTVASLNLGNKLSGFFDRLFGSSNKNDSNPGQTGQTEEKDSTEQGGNQLTATGGASNDPVTESDITLTKTAEDKGKDGQGNQLFDIKLGVQGTEKRTSKKVDIVLILDASSSMTTSLQKMTKKAAKTFVQKVFADTGVNPSVAVVSYGSTACARNYSDSSWTFYGSSFSSNNYSSNKDAIERAIDNAYSVNNGGGTNTEGAFLVAKELTSSNVKRSDAEHLTVFMTDGVPTQHYYTSRWGKLDTDGGGNYTTIEDQNKAIDAAISLSEDSSIYNVALTGGIKGNKNQNTEERRLVAEKFMKQPPYKMTNDGTGKGQSLTFSSEPSKSYAKAYYNITTTNENDASSQMEEIYKNIASQAISLVKNGVVTDVLPKGFVLTKESKTMLENDANATFTENSDGTTTITYKNVAAEKEATYLPTISVKYTGDGYGAAYTNSSATYSGKLYDGTANGKDFSKPFPKPVAGLHPKTVDDTDSTSVGTKITVDVKGNDGFERLTVAGYTVSDYTIVLTDKDGKEVSYTGDFTATIDDNSRQLQFTSTTAGTKELYYVVKANITTVGDNFATNCKTELVSRPTKVTINVYGAANKAFVIDFGKPVTYKANQVFDGVNELNAKINLQNGNGTYGNLTIDSNKSITYKLKKFMDGIDVFKFDEVYSDKTNTTNTTNTTKGVSIEKTVSMVPASSIYYEDNFADEDGNTLIHYGDGWEPLGTDTIKFVVGDKEYGSDSKYANNLHDSGMVHCIKTADTMGTATFSFKGTGIDIYSRVTSETGKVRVDLYRGNTLVARQTVNSVSVDGTRYQIPVFSFNNLERDTYTVKLTVPKNTTYYLDGVRIYSSISESENVNNNQTVGDVYNKDGEANAVLYHLREKSLTNLTNILTVSGQNWITDYTDTKGGYVKAHPSTIGSTESKKYGPLNEIYIKNGQKVTITLDDSVKFESLQLGVKTIEGASSIKINGTQTKTLNSATDMFVKIAGNSKVITIENTGDHLVSLTYLKVIQGNVENK